MITDPSPRVRRALKEYVDAVPVPEADVRRVLAADQPPGTGARPWLVPLAAAGVVLLLVALVAAAPSWLDAGSTPPGQTTNPARLPDRVAVRDWPGSLVTAPVSTDPPGRAVALFTQGNGAGMPLSNTKWVTVDADSTSYRRVTAAEGYDPATALLSADGTRVAYARDDSISVVDLADGAVRTHQVPDVADPVPVAWSADGRRIGYVEHLGGTGPEGPGFGTSLRVLELRTGRTVTYRGEDGVSAAAFAPDGRRLAIQDGDRLVIVGPGTGDRREIDIPAGYELAGAAAWSPDGRVIATVPAETYPEAHQSVWFAELSGEGRPGPGLGSQDQVAEPFLGWRSTGSVLVARSTGDGIRIVEVALNRGEEKVLSRFNDDWESDETAIYDLQLATALLPDLEVRPAGPPDYGPWPGWLRTTIGGVALTPVLLVALVVMVARRPRRPAAPPPPGADPGAAADPSG